ncbi:hypothetical protein A8B75_12030 [Sphingomonadales bacterium EhC05]|nr:hypothetical protein A8B75_12030 [Sphingomonadales bacterium EhC05]
MLIKQAMALPVFIIIPILFGLLQKMSPRLAKETYALQQTPKFERGQIMLPREAKWLDTYKKELLSFPHGKHDDFVDSTTLFLRAMDTGRIVELIHRARQAHCYDNDLVS